MKDRWSQLSLKDKSDLMSLYIRNGISSLEEIKKHYNSFADGDHLYQDGGPDDDKTFVVSQASETGWMPEVQITADRPKWQIGLTAYDWSRAKQYYSDENGYITPQGFAFLKNVASKRRTGKSDFMRDVDRLAAIPNAAVGAIGAIPAAAGLIASATTPAGQAFIADAVYSTIADQAVNGVSYLNTGKSITENLVDLGVNEKIAPFIAPSTFMGTGYKPLFNFTRNVAFNKKGAQQLITDVKNTVVKDLSKADRQLGNIDRGAQIDFFYDSPKFNVQKSLKNGLDECAHYEPWNNTIVMQPLTMFQSPKNYQGVIVHEASHQYDNLRGLSQLADKPYKYKTLGIKQSRRYYVPYKDSPNYGLLKPFEKAASKQLWHGSPNELVAEMLNWKYQSNVLNNPFNTLDEKLQRDLTKKASNRFKIKKDELIPTLQGLSTSGYFDKGGSLNSLINTSFEGPDEPEDDKIYIARPLQEVQIIGHKNPSQAEILQRHLDNVNSFYYNDVVPRLQREHQGLKIKPDINFPYINSEDIDFNPPSLGRGEAAAYVNPIFPQTIHSYERPTETEYFGNLMAHENSHRWQFEHPKRDKQYKDKSKEMLRQAYGNFTNKFRNTYKSFPAFIMYGPNRNVINIEYEADNRAARYDIWRDYIDLYHKIPTIEELDKYIDEIPALDLYKRYIKPSGYLDVYSKPPTEVDKQYGSFYEDKMKSFEENIQKIREALKHVAQNNSLEDLPNYAAYGGKLNQ